MIRARFKANYDDSRPVKWPPPGPFWETGTAGDGSYAIIVAYADSEDQIREFWPEAADIDAQEATEYIFTSRFPKPDWWQPDQPAALSQKA